VVFNASWYDVLTAGLSSEALVTAAQSMEEIFYSKGDVIIEQDDIGDSFFVLEEGRVSVTVSTTIVGSHGAVFP
jgi:CRP-like cAMP-binding protein